MDTVVKTREWMKSQLVDFAKRRRRRLLARNDVECTKCRQDQRFLMRIPIKGTQKDTWTVNTVKQTCP